MSDVLWLLGGLGGLIAGSELIVRVAKNIAARLGVSALVIGLTVTSIGTSIPELVTNVTVGVNALVGDIDASGVAVGNILGSCLAQITLLLGMAGLARGLAAPTRSREGVALVGAIGAVALVGMDGVVGRAEGFMLISCYAVYLALVAYQEKGSVDAPVEVTRGPAADVAFGIGGLGILVVSAQIVVTSAISVATTYGMDETTVGVLVGVATCLPELSVAMISVWHGEEGHALGNLLGSNITDPLLSFGAGAAVHPVNVVPSALAVDYLFWCASTAVALLLLRTRSRLDREESAVLLIIFGLYLSIRLLM